MSDTTAMHRSGSVGHALDQYGNATANAQENGVDSVDGHHRHSSYAGTEQHLRQQSIDEHVINMSTTLSSDAHSLLEKFRQSFDTMLEQHTGVRPNVLCAGCTGAGKSTLVNRVFGRQVARTGSGVPITQHFDRYDLPDSSVVIYDSKGLEVGEHQNFIKTTREFLKENSDPKGKHGIHVCWYIINSAGSRFQPFEAEVCKELFQDLPIIFILNKSDLSSDEDRAQLRQSIADLQLKNCVAILDAISTPSLSSLKIPDLCPQCGSDDLDIRRKKQQMQCEDCGFHASLEAKSGLAEIVSATVQALPKRARESFVTAQRVSIHEKNRQVRRIILEFAKHDFSKARLERSVFKMVAKMLIRLSILWEFREHGHVYGHEVAKSHMQHGSFRDRIFLLMHTKHKAKQQLLAHTVALGLLWNQCVRNMYRRLFVESYGTMTSTFSDEDLDRMLPQMLNESFADLNSEKIEEFEQMIERNGAEAVIDQMIPEDIEKDESCAVDVAVRELHNAAVSAKRSQNPGRQNQLVQSEFVRRPKAERGERGGVVHSGGTAMIRNASEGHARGADAGADDHDDDSSNEGGARHTGRKHRHKSAKESSSKHSGRGGKHKHKSEREKSKLATPVAEALGISGHHHERHRSHGNGSDRGGSSGEEAMSPRQQESTSDEDGARLTSRGTSKRSHRRRVEE